MKRLTVSRAAIARIAGMTLAEIGTAIRVAALDAAARTVIRCLDPQWARPAPEPFVEDAMLPAADEWSDDPMGGYDDHDATRQRVELCADEDEEPSPSAPSATQPPQQPAARQDQRRVFFVTECTYCGRVDVPAGDVYGVFYRNKLAISWYGFDCPVCAERTIRPASSDATRAALLSVTGAHIIIDTIPAEVLEEHPPGPPITLDAVLDAHLWLETHDDLAALARVIDITDGGNR